MLVTWINWCWSDGESSSPSFWMWPIHGSMEAFNWWWNLEKTSCYFRENISMKFWNFCRRVAQLKQRIDCQAPFFRARFRNFVTRPIDNNISWYYITQVISSRFAIRSRTLLKQQFNRSSLCTEIWYWARRLTIELAWGNLCKVTCDIWLLQRSIKKPCTQLVDWTDYRISQTEEIVFWQRIPKYLRFKLEEVKWCKVSGLKLWTVQIKHHRVRG